MCEKVLEHKAIPSRMSLTEEVFAGAVTPPIVFLARGYSLPLLSLSLFSLLPLSTHTCVHTLANYYSVEIQKGESTMEAIEKKWSGCNYVLIRLALFKTETIVRHLSQSEK